jgi:hypothetical protein
MLQAPLQHKDRCLEFITCNFCVAFRGFAKEPFLPTNVKPQHRLNNCLYYTPFGALRCHTAKVRETYTPKPRTWCKPCVKVRNQSRVSVFLGLVGSASSNNTIVMNKYTWEGNNYRIYARIQHMRSNPNKHITHRSALIPLLGIRSKNQKKI